MNFLLNWHYLMLQKMAVTADGILFTALYVLGGIIMNAVSTAFFLIPAVLLIAVYFIVQRFYISSSRYSCHFLVLLGNLHVMLI